jgi:hypothetical protein
LLGCSIGFTCIRSFASGTTATGGPTTIGGVRFSIGDCLRFGGSISSNFFFLIDFLRTMLWP